LDCQLASTKHKQTNNVSGSSSTDAEEQTWHYSTGRRRRSSEITVKRPDRLTIVISAGGKCTRTTQRTQKHCTANQAATAAATVAADASVAAAVGSDDDNVRKSVATCANRQT
jgi:hypothetical protein